MARLRTAAYILDIAVCLEGLRRISEEGSDAFLVGGALIALGVVNAAAIYLTAGNAARAEKAAR